MWWGKKILPGWVIFSPSFSLAIVISINKIGPKPDVEELSAEEKFEKF
jgi:hypothetical protein